MRMPRFPLILSALALSRLLSVPVCAVLCTVPDATYPTIQSAVDHPDCTAIQLNPLTYPESVRVARSLAITGAGAGTVVGGFLRADGDGVVVTVSALRVEANCPLGSLQSFTGAEIVAVNVEAISSGSFDCPDSLDGSIFSDGFESGDTSTWSSSVP